MPSLLLLVEREYATSHEYTHIKSFIWNGSRGENEEREWLLELNILHLQNDVFCNLHFMTWDARQIVNSKIGMSIFLSFIALYYVLPTRRWNENTQ